MKLDCRTCGACCVPEFDAGTHADVTTEDVRRMSRAARARVEFIRGETYGSITTKYDGANNAVCAFLQGTVGRHVSCRVYETRPEVCRKFPVGSKSCLAARARAHL